LVGRIIAVGLAHPGLDAEPWKQGALLNALDICDYRDWLQASVEDLANRDEFIVEAAIADCAARIRPLERAGFHTAAQRAVEEFLAKRISVDGVTEHAQAKPTRNWLWADTAYMVPPGMAVMGQEDVATADLLGLYRHLAAPNGLLRHIKQGIDYPPAEQLVGPTEWIDGSAWGRGNGWFVAGSVDSIGFLPGVDTRVVANFQAACEALLRYQDESATWRATVDDPETPAEMSGTVMITYAFLKGNRLDLLPSAYRDAALRALARVMSAHFDWSSLSLRDQQFGPMVTNVPTRTTFESGLSYGQAFLAMCLHEAWA
jgi:unsaturated rhamnogalacturonyl hydrolase